MSKNQPDRVPTAPTPAPDTRKLLRELLLVWRKVVLEFRSAKGLAALATPPVRDVLTRTVWLSENPEGFSNMPALVPAPSDAGVMLDLLNRLLQVDRHLGLTCLNAMKLASALQYLGLRELADVPGLEQSTLDDLERVADHFVARLFESAYLRRAYFRFYNLQIDVPLLPIPPLNAALQHRGSWEITSITRESTPLSTLHLEGTGNIFLLFEDRGPLDDNEWWTARWEDAHAVLQVMKYLKSEVIDIDYSVLHFSPPWVNEVRRYGLSLWGRPRADVQAHRYALSNGEEASLLRYLSAAAVFKPQLEAMGPSSRQAIATAGDYYEGHHRRQSLEDQLIDLVIALEALFSPGDGELTFRIAHRAALLLGSNLEERKTIAAFLRKAYGGRSRLVHRGKSPFAEKKPSENLSAEDLRRLADLIRQAILRLAVIYLGGGQDREQALTSIEDSAYDPASLDELRARTDLDSFLRGHGLGS